MSLNFGPNPKVFGSGGKAVDFSVDPSVSGGGKWTTLAPKRWPGFNASNTHPLAHDGSQVADRVRQYSIDGNMPQALEDFLRSRLGWDGGKITHLEAVDLNSIEGPAGQPWTFALNGLLPVVDPGVPATPPVTPPPVTAPPPRPHPAPAPTPAPSSDALMQHLEAALAEINAAKALLSGGGGGFSIAGN